MTTHHPTWTFWVDRGGTFTDVVGISHVTGDVHVTKVLSDESTNWVSCPSEDSKSENSFFCDATRGIRAILKLQDHEVMPPLDCVKLGTTIGTNALLERKGSPTVFLTTVGHTDTLTIRRQTRPDIFALNIQRPPPLTEHVLGVNERMLASGDVLVPFDEQRQSELLDQLKEFRQAHKTVTACAICLLHAHKSPLHEKQVGYICGQAGFESVVLSHHTDPIENHLLRSETTVIDAYLTPVISTYISRFSREVLQYNSSSSLKSLSQTPVDQKALSQTAVVQAGTPHKGILLMKSNGTLSPATSFHGCDSILSGPAGGVVAALEIARAKGIKNVVSLDMGGTSTDVARITGEIPYRLQCVVGGYSLTRPSVAVHTVAAGGSSIARFRSGRLTVGPDSAGAVPGPACYRHSGPLTVTDCNVALGRIQKDLFPAVFGPDKNLPIDADATRAILSDVRQTIVDQYLSVLESPTLDNITATDKMPTWMRTIEGVAERFVEIAVQEMASAVRNITTEKGINLAGYSLCCFGGAGGQHACRVAEILGLEKVIIHPLSSVLSAIGIGLARQAQTAQTSITEELRGEKLKESNKAIYRLFISVRQEMEKFGIPLSQQRFDSQLRLSYRGTDTVLMCNYYTALGGAALLTFSDAATSDVGELAPDPTIRYLSTHQPSAPHRLRTTESLREEFVTKHLERFGFTLPDNHQIDVVSVSVSSSLAVEPDKTFWSRNVHLIPNTGLNSSNQDRCNVFINGAWDSVPLLNLWDLPEKGQIAGPALIVDPIGTNLLLSGWVAEWGCDRCLVLSHSWHSGTRFFQAPDPTSLETADPFWLEILNKQFQAIAEDMGVVLKDTSQSINIKERLDFSCAVFDPQGNLLANAPHIPVHLGSMGDTVCSLIQHLQGQFRAGDVFATNDPFAGGTHLPDITVTTPIFVGEINVGFVASRGHHVDVGGIVPGSMPSNSHSLKEEGVILSHFLLVSEGMFRMKELLEVLTIGRWPARAPLVNIADLRAQVAANHRGAMSVISLIEPLEMLCGILGRGATESLLV